MESKDKTMHTLIDIDAHTNKAKGNDYKEKLIHTSALHTYIHTHTKEQSETVGQEKSIHTQLNINIHTYKKNKLKRLANTVAKPH